MDTQAESSKDSAFFSKFKGKPKKYENRDFKCYTCGGKNHKSYECTSKKAKEKAAKEKGTVNRSFSARLNIDSVKNNDWYMDSGTGDHMTPDESIVMDKKPVAFKEITVANDDKIKVKSQGSMKLRIVDEEINISRVLHVPELAANLLSVFRIVQAGNSVVFDQNGCTIFDSAGIEFANCKPTDGVYRFRAVSPKCFLTKREVNSALTWHRRFGHINFQSLKKMRNGIVSGMEFNEKEIDGISCEVCSMGKQTRLPFKPSETKTTELLEIIHSDLVGKMETTSIGGAKYLLTFIDDYSRKVFVYFLKQKSDVLNTFVDFKVFVENQTGRKIKTFRTDGGGEYCSKVFDRFCRKTGIHHETTMAHTPQQNGVAERMNRTIVERAKCMIFDASLDDSYWAEACNMAVYLINRSVCASLVDKTPEEVWTGNKVDVSHLKIFGSTVMVHIPKQRRGKWNAKSEKHNFVGYDSDKKGFRCMNPKTKKLTLSRDVIFNEQSISSSTGIDVSIEPMTDDTNQVREVSASGTSDSNQTVSDANSPEVEPIPVQPVNPSVVRDVGNSTDESFVSARDENEMDDTIRESNFGTVEPDPDFTTRAQLPADIRKSSREPKQRQFEGYVSHLAYFTNNSDPTTAKDALNSENSDEWKRAMQDEMQSLEENNTWTVVDLPKGRKAIKTKWVFTTKKDENGRIVRYKARFVAKGCAQKYGIDYHDTFSPVIRYPTIRFLVALAAKKGPKIDQMDLSRHSCKVI